MNSIDSAPATDVDELLTALTHRHCRVTISHFRGGSEEVAALDDLADEIATHVPEDCDELAVRLHHVTLPRLEEVGLLEYDPRSHAVRYRGHPTLEGMVENLLGPAPQ